MKKQVLYCIFTMCSFAIFGQNINDHKISFNYVQLPLIKVDPQFDRYEIVVENDFERANEDSLALFAARESAALEFFKAQNVVYYRQRDSLDRLYLGNLSVWEKNTNAGVKNPDGSDVEKPAPPIYPFAPIYPKVEMPILHAPFASEMVSERMQLAGYEIGADAIQVTVTIHPICNIRITSTKKGVGAATNYEYTAHYVLPVGLKVSSPSQGILMQTTLFDTERTYNMRDQKSQYDHELYMMDNKEAFFRELETYARAQALTRANNHLNSNFGFVEKTRTTEIYSVKSFKSYDYTDVTNAMTKTNKALQAIGADKDRSEALIDIQDAMNAIKGILEDANLSDNKARINDKITAMLQCNLIELYVWKAEFDKADATINMVLNSGEGKAKRHLQGETNFYADQRKRWEANY